MVAGKALMGQPSGGLQAPGEAVHLWASITPSKTPPGKGKSAGIQCNIPSNPANFALI